MPKPIKKRVTKKTAPEKEVLTVFEICKNYYLDNKRFVHLAGLAIVVLLFLSFLTINYLSSKSEKAHNLTYEGYKLLTSTSSEKEKGKEQLKEALEKFKEAYEKDHSAESLYYIANTQYKLGNYSDALKSLDTIITKFKGNKEILALAYLKKATILLNQDKKQEALKVLNELYTSDTQYLKDVSLFEQARILESLGKKDEAKKKYELLVKEFPTSPYKTTAEAKIKPAEEKTKKEKPKKEETEKAEKGKKKE